MADEQDTGAQGTPAAPAAASDAGDAAPNTVMGGADAPTDNAGDQASGDQGAGEGDAGDDAGDDAPAGAPEKYELALPDGMVLDETMFAQAEPVLRELNLTNEQASKLASVIAAHRASEVEAHVQQVQEWGKQAAADAEIGGKAFPENVELARSALAAHGTPELKALLDSTGLGNHPEVIRFFTRVGRTVPKEDGVARGERSGGEKSLAERLYGKTSPN